MLAGIELVVTVHTPGLAETDTEPGSVLAQLRM